LLLFATTTILQIIVPLARIEITYRVVDFDNAAVLAGLLSAAFALLPVLLFRRIGSFGDAYGERPMLFVGVLLVAAATLGLLLRSGQLFELFAASALLGLGQMVLLSAMQLAIVRCGAPGEQDRLLGHFLVAISLGMAIAPLVLSWVTPSGASDPGTSLDPLLIGGAAVLVLAGMLLAFLLPKPSVTSAVGQTSYRTLLQTPGMLMLIGCSGICLAVNDSFLAFFPLLANARGIDVETVGLLLSLRAVGSMASRFLFAGIARRVGKREVMAFTMLGAGASVAALIVDMPVPLLAILMGLSGFGLGLAIACSLSLTLTKAPPGTRARAASLRLSVARLAQFAFPLAAGTAASVLGAGSVFAIMGVALMSGGVWARLTRLSA
jgi:MFS family permease